MTRIAEKEGFFVEVCNVENILPQLEEERRLRFQDSSVKIDIIHISGDVLETKILKAGESWLIECHKGVFAEKQEFILKISGYKGALMYPADLIILLCDGISTDIFREYIEADLDIEEAEVFVRPESSKDLQKDERYLEIVVRLEKATRIQYERVEE